ncbi:MAG: RNHCP domain-containing protein [Patescibacteria group bacterium]|nr:RNHCP domain-containing protein [Patescibacteria group bacterium]
MNQGKKFQKKVEDFICANCGHEVKGTGFTNHCPECFYSLHVDVNPGDRESACNGLMKLIRVELIDGEQTLVQKCIKCGHERKNKLQPEDNRENLYKIIKALSRS